MLIAAGAGPNARTEGRTPATPLHWAASSNDAEALIDGGADIEAPGGSIGTPLDNAVGDGCWWHVVGDVALPPRRRSQMLEQPSSSGWSSMSSASLNPMAQRQSTPTP